MTDTNVKRFTSPPAPVLPHGLGDLLELYERNYMMLRLLAPRMQQFSQRTYLSHVPGCMDLYVGVLECAPFTTTLHLTYHFSAPGLAGRQQPDMLVRVYHDARSAEVLSGLMHGKRHELRTQRSLQRSWRINRFLYKWLCFCVRQGHRVDAAQPWSPRLQAPQPGRAAE